MKFRIQAEDGRHVEWEQPTGPLLWEVETVLTLTEAEAQELWLELGFHILKLRNPERYRDRD